MQVFFLIFFNFPTFCTFSISQRKFNLLICHKMLFLFFYRPHILSSPFIYYRRRVIMIHILNKYIPRKDRPAFAFIAASGVFNHFLYEWSGCALTAFFCPVNESVWEHLKLLFFPFLFWTLWNYLCNKPRPSSYFFYRLLSVICGMMFTITLFYTYTGIIGRNFLLLDILIFMLSIIFTLRLIPPFTKRLPSVPPLTATYTAWIAVILCFFTFTCFPPDIPLFFA